jgi:hypothetical protein
MRLSMSFGCPEKGHICATDKSWQTPAAGGWLQQAAADIGPVFSTLAGSDWEPTSLLRIGLAMQATVASKC